MRLAIYIDEIGQGYIMDIWIHNMIAVVYYYKVYNVSDEHDQQLASDGERASEE